MLGPAIILAGTINVPRKKVDPRAGFPPPTRLREDI